MAILGVERRHNYFDMFRESAAIALRAAEALHESIAAGGLEEAALQQIKTIEHEGDLHVHRSRKELERAFITPLDSEDMLALLGSLEDITDAIDSIARTVYMTHTRQRLGYLESFSGLILETVRLVGEMAALLGSKSRASREKQRELIIEVNRFEEQGDQTYLRALRDLFGGNFEALDVLRLKTVYDQCEEALDRCEDVADRFEQILITVN
ncbi:MAG: DUF47 family protein [Bacillota bacterium]|nr:DUF47 family protein [Bacillota bacterium]